MTCSICTHAEEHGWYGPGFTGEHCRDCHRSWTGLAECHCAGCHHHFGSDSAFDTHQVGDNSICHDPATMTDKHGVLRFKAVQRASGRVWVGNSARPDLASFAPGPQCSKPLGDPRGTNVGVQS